MNDVKGGREFAGFVVVLVCMAGAIYSGIATASQWAYFRAKYGEARTNPRKAVSLCALADELYSLNFYTACYAAQTSFDAAFASSADDERAAWLAGAQRWCDRGLRRNPHDRTLRLLQVSLLEVEHGPQAAVESLERYVDWHFWYSENHRLLAELYARCGDFDKARQELYVIRDRAGYAEAERSVQEQQEDYISGLLAAPRAPVVSPPEGDSPPR